ncbi:hypothetical protein ACFLTS_05565 [Chloroflexota bacterium]
MSCLIVTFILLKKCSIDYDHICRFHVVTLAEVLVAKPYLAGVVRLAGFAVPVRMSGSERQSGLET